MVTAVLSAVPASAAPTVAVLPRATEVATPTLSAIAPVGPADVSLSYEGVPHVLTVPDGAEGAFVTMTGASGGSGYRQADEPLMPGGNGAIVSAVFPAAAGAQWTFTIGLGGESADSHTGKVATGGWGGSAGGGDAGGGLSGAGGGASSLIVDEQPLLVAGGGGGGGGLGVLVSGGQGGSAGGSTSDANGQKGSGGGSGDGGKAATLTTSSGTAGTQGKDDGGDGGGGGGGGQGGEGGQGGGFGGGGGGGGAAGTVLLTGNTNEIQQVSTSPGWANGSAQIWWVSALTPTCGTSSAVVGLVTATSLPLTQCDLGELPLSGLEVTSQPSHGLVATSIDPAGSFTYTPDASSGYTGFDTFSYQVTNIAGNTATGTVTLLVAPSKFYLQDSGSDLYLDAVVVGGSPQGASYSGYPGQQWIATNNADGTISLQSPIIQQCITAGTPVLLASCGSPGQGLVLSSSPPGFVLSDPASGTPYSLQPTGSMQALSLASPGAIWQLSSATDSEQPPASPEPTSPPAVPPAPQPAEGPSSADQMLPATGTGRPATGTLPATGGEVPVVPLGVGGVALLIGMALWFIARRARRTDETALGHNTRR